MSDKTLKLTGTLLQRLYGPHGQLEGVLVASGSDIQQMVLAHDDEVGCAQLLGLSPGAGIQARVVPLPGRDASRHPVMALVRLEGLGRARTSAPVSSGIVTAFHFSRHGEPNGFMLDNGDFIHTGPDGMSSLLTLDVGDLVQVRGEAQPLSDASGKVVEASHINGKAVRRGGKARTSPKTGPVAKKAAKKAVKKAVKKATKKSARKATKSVLDAGVGKARSASVRPLQKSARAAGSPGSTATKTVGKARVVSTARAARTKPAATRR